jgi:hypothetical protein
MGVFMKLQNEVDTEAIGLLARFGDAAIQSGDPKTFLKEVLRAVVDAPTVPGGPPKVVSVRVLPPKK